ncbi:hypothetical protein PIB30_067731 [Stylosanthes scabra]|uniref:Uncharacterized protein n=1 Tax=Stylosanthes scabra TaxID=79078 RepID=A0ABU6UMP0_9FABA|nr:hypothetical protein [Stylosanthes scabra]
MATVDLVNGSDDEGINIRDGEKRERNDAEIQDDDPCNNDARRESEKSWEED